MNVYGIVKKYYSHVSKRQTKDTTRGCGRNQTVFRHDVGCKTCNVMGALK